MHANEVIWKEENGEMASETSYRCNIMRRVIREEVAAGGSFEFFSGFCTTSLPMRGGLKISLQL